MLALTVPLDLQLISIVFVLIERNARKTTMKDQYSHMAMGIAIGVAIGAAIGTAIDNPPIGIAVGIAIGAGVGAAWSALR